MFVKGKLLRGGILFIAVIALAIADSKVFKFIEDDDLSGYLESARTRFMITRPFGPPDRLDAAILIPEPSDPSGRTWRRGLYNADETAYPASCVKLTYLASTMHWLAQQGLPYDTLDDFVRPMITVSSNLHTGMVVDTITGALNNRSMTTPSPAFDAWVQQRLSTARFLDSRGLLENQTVVHKTYPANSGYNPEGAEALARQQLGMNAMCPRLAASLMLEIAKGAIEPAARDYMLQLLMHPVWDSEAPFGLGGLPPGTINHNKPGNAYNDENDIAYFILPNGQEVVMSAFSDAFEAQPSPYVLSNLGVFAGFVLQDSGLCKGCPPMIILNTTDSQTHGTWDYRTDMRDKYGTHFLVSNPDRTTGNTVTWSVPVSEGLWEVAVWSPQSDSFSAAALVTVSGPDGDNDNRISQRVRGGRWVYLGDYYATAKLTVVVSDNGAGGPVAANAVRLTQWPSCKGVIGRSCEQIAVQQRNRKLAHQFS